MAKSHELHDMSDAELERKLAEAKEELFNLRFQLVTGQLDNPMKIKDMRKTVARIMTEIRAREIGALTSTASTVQGEEA